MDLTPGATLVKTHWRLIALVAVAAAIVGYVGSYAFSPSYSATTHVLMRINDTSLLNASGQPNSTSGLIDPNLTTSLGDTYSTLITSRDLAQNVDQQLKLDQRPADTSLMAKLRSGVRNTITDIHDIVWYGNHVSLSTHEANVRAIQSNLTATQLKTSLVIEVKASAADPKLAPEIADAASTKLIQMSATRAQQEANTHKDFLQTQLDQAQANLNSALQNEQQYESANGITSPDLQSQVGVQTVASLSDQLKQANVDLSSTQAQLGALQAALAEVAPTAPVTSTISSGRASTTITNTQDNPIYDNLQTQVTILQATAAALTAKRDALASYVSSGGNSGLSPDAQAHIKSLDDQINASTAAFGAVTNDYQQAVITAAEGSVELTKLDSASGPVYPDKPLRYLYLLIGLLIGAVGGIGLAQWREGHPQLAADPRWAPATPQATPRVPGKLELE